MITVDLFAGAGGFTEGAEEAGAEVVWAANHWQLAVDYHQRNHPHVVHACQDLQQADPRIAPRHGLLIASPACQGHSNAATRGGTGRRGTAPAHDYLRASAWAVITFAEVHRPRALLVENVVEFRRWALFEPWLAALRALGYALGLHIVNAADLGVPQSRKRLFVVGTRSRRPLDIHLPMVPRANARTFVDVEGGEGWEPVSCKSDEVRARVAKGRRRFPRGAFLSQHTTDHPGRSLDRPIGTITTKHQWAIVRRGRHCDEMRMLNRTEYIAAMSFPPDYKLPAEVTVALELLGGAVCPVVARELVAAVRRAA